MAQTSSLAATLPARGTLSSMVTTTVFNSGAEVLSEEFDCSVSSNDKQQAMTSTLASIALARCAAMTVQLSATSLLAT